MSELENSIHTEIVLLRERVDTVINTHGGAIDKQSVLVNSAHSKIEALALQSNTHEVKISELVYRQRGTFGNIFIIIATLLSLGSIAVSVFL